MHGTTSGRRAPLLALVLATLLLPLGALNVQADTVVSSERVETLPAGDFGDAGDWTLSTNTVYTSDPAEWSTVLVSDDHLSFTHDRGQRLDSTTLWATNTSTDSNASLGAPDGFYTWSAGPPISVAGFDASSVSQYPLVNVSLVISFSVPDTLQQDSVRFIVHYPTFQDLVQTWSHSFEAIDHFTNPWSTSLDDDANWSWSLIEALEIEVDYNSVGGTDDSRVEVDAVGLTVTYQTPDFGFETARALHTATLASPPVNDLDLAAGTLDNLTIGPGGLEVLGARLFGTWTSEVQARPFGQDWGRFHVADGADNSTFQVRTSVDDTTWTAWSAIDDGDQLPDTPYLQVAATVDDDDVLAGVRLSYNDPFLHLNGSVSGSVDGLNATLSPLIIAVNGAEVARRSLASTGDFSLSVPVGWILPAAGGELEVGLAQWFNWNSDGAPVQTVVHIHSVSITGGFLLDIDRDPTCDAIDPPQLAEDGGGALVPVLRGCSDDRTLVDDLVLSVASSEPGILAADVVGDEVRLVPIAGQSGSVDVTVRVTDGVGNQWVQVMPLVVAAVNDPPVVTGAPRDVAIEVGEVATWQLSITDEDDSSGSLAVGTNVPWATVDSGFVLRMAPTEVGTQTVLLTVNDGSVVVNATILVTITARADLSIEAIDISGGSSPLVSGELVSLSVNVRNSGRSAATFVSVRCYADGVLIGSAPELTVVDVGALELATVPWRVAGDDAVTLTCEVDHGEGGDIPELSETNNEFSIPLTVEAAGGQVDDTGDGGVSGGLEAAPQGAMWGLALVVLIGLAVVVLFGPGRIRKVR